MAGNFTTSKLPDGQAMQQSMMSMLSAVQAGGNYILHSAGFLDGLLSMSCEKFIMDCDLCGALHAYLAGFEAGDETLAFEALAERGPGAHLFGSAHTMRHYRTAYWDSGFNDDRTWEAWSEDGAEDGMLRANRMWKERLKEYEPPPLAPDRDEALRDFVARRKASMKDAWH